MSSKDELTISNLIQAMKDSGFITEEKLDGRLNKLEQKFIRKSNKDKREILTTMSKLALSTPTRKEFEELKRSISN